MVGTGDRSEKIRTYNFPQNRVTDHRIGLTLHQLDLVMEGKLDQIFDARACSARFAILSRTPPSSPAPPDWKFISALWRTPPACCDLAAGW
jgi:hypothetical protein